MHIQFGSTHPHSPYTAWALFNMASLYWRVSGDPQNTVECLRRVIHFAPAEAKDVGYIGLASVLHRYGYLSDAVVVARAALDITGGTVGLGRRVICHLIVILFISLAPLLPSSPSTYLLPFPLLLLSSPFFPSLPPSTPHSQLAITF